MLIFEILVFALICVQLVIMTNNKQNKPTNKEESLYLNKTRYMMISLQYASILIALISIPNNEWKIGVIVLPIIVNCIGVSLMLCGLLTRIYSMRLLGKYYSTLLFANSDHKLINTGMYKYIRHPIYLGDLILYLGYGLALSNYIVFIVLLSSFIIAYLVRINQEEKMMITSFGNEYQNYCKSTKKIIPFIY